MSELLAALRRNGVTDADESALARALYSSDASLYRIPPQVVVRPRDADEVLATIATARETGTAADHARRRHLDRRQRGRPGHRGRHQPLAQPGGGDRRRPADRARAARGRARRAPARGPATRPALRAGPVHPHPLHDRRDARQQRLRLAGPGLRPVGRQRGRAPGRRSPTAPCSTSRVPGTEGLAALVDGHLSTVRTEFGRFGRQVSGYSFEHLLPENGRRLDRFLVGSEGTLAVVLEAEVTLVEDAPARALAVLGFPSMADAADAVPALLAHPLGRLRGARPPDRRRGAHARRPRARPAAGRGLAVRGGDRRRRGRGGGAGPGGRPHRRRPAPGRHRPVPSRPRSGGSARTAPAWPPARSTVRPSPGGRTPRCRRTGSATTCATSTPCCATPASTACPTATSVTAACTCGSTSRSTTARDAAGSAGSSRTRPTWSRRTAAACRASTATAGRARSCCRGCTPPRRST